MDEPAEGFEEQEAADRILALEVLQHRQETRLWRLQKRVAVKTIMSDLEDLTEGERRVLASKFNRERSIMQ